MLGKERKGPPTVIGTKMQRTRTTGGSNEDGCQNSSQQRDQACDADPTTVSKAGKEQAPIAVAAALEFNPAYVKLRFGPDLLLAALNSVGVAGWNDLLKRLRQANIVFSTIGMDDVPPMMADMDCTGADLSRRTLDGIDLRYVTLDGANLSGCSLRGARFWWVRQANFQNADLRDATFVGSDLSGTDFTGANTCGVGFDEVTYFDESPPIGLPVALLAWCEALPWDHTSRRVERRLKDDDETK